MSVYGETNKHPGSKILATLLLSGFVIILFFIMRITLPKRGLAFIPGQQLTLEEWSPLPKGSMPRILLLVTPKCPHCLNTLNTYDRIYKKHDSHIPVVALLVGSQEELIVLWKLHNWSLPATYITERHHDKFQGLPYPQITILDENHRVTQTHIGSRSESLELQVLKEQGIMK